MTGFMRRLRIGPRLTISFSLVILLMGVAVVVGFNVSQSQQRSYNRVAALQALTLQLEQVNFYNADISGWQATYAWDAHRLGAAKAVDPTSVGRAGFLADKPKLEALLQRIGTDEMTATERSLFADVKKLWAEFFATDVKVIEAYKNGNLKLGDSTVLGGWDAYGKILENSDKLTASVSGRAKAEQRSADASAARSRTVMLAVTALAVMLAVTVLLLVTRSITGPLQRAGEALRRLADRDLTVREDSGELAARDEIGEMHAVLADAVEGLRAAVATMASTADGVRTTSEVVRGVTTEVVGGAEETTAQANLVASTAEEMARGVHTVSAGAEEMGSSINEIAQNANHAAEVAARAVTEAEATNDTVNKLGESSAEIGDVVKLITSIAEQTNLLALNATIEAARAGDAGKGFAVVAGEVKDLAQETAKATQDISRLIEAIQADTTGAVEAIGSISKVIADINDYQVTIASAVEEQSATTNEMTRSIAQIATGSQEITSSIGSVAEVSGRTLESVNGSRQAVEDLTASADRLKEMVATFRIDTTIDTTTRRP